MIETLSKYFSASGPIRIPNFRPASPQALALAQGLVSIDERNWRVFMRRERVERVARWLRSCAVCSACLPPIDYLCASCWRDFGVLMNRGEELRQDGYVLPTYSLLTWTPQTEDFIRPFIYGFKGGHKSGAAKTCADMFLTELALANGLSREGVSILSAPSDHFDHSKIWAGALAKKLESADLASPFVDKADRETRQKQLRQGERGHRRYQIREEFAGWVGPSRRYVFADDVVTSGSTAMAAYMALGDPDQFAVWSLVSRPRLAAK